VTCGEGGVK